MLGGCVVKELDKRGKYSSVTASRCITFSDHYIMVMTSTLTLSINILCCCSES